MVVFLDYISRGGQGIITGLGRQGQAAVFTIIG